MPRIVPLEQACARLAELLSRMEAQHERLVITREGRPVAVVVSAYEWESIEETLAVLQDDDALAALRESDDDVKASRLLTLGEVRRGLGLR